MNIPPPDARIEIIDRSMRCFVFGFVSLIPVAGLPVAAWVLMQNWSIRRRFGTEWNPARRYLHWGCVCASWGAGFSTLVAIYIGVAASMGS